MALSRPVATVAEPGNRFSADRGAFKDVSELTAWDNNTQITIGGVGRAPIVINNAALTSDSGWRAARYVGIDYAPAFQIRFSTLGFDDIRFSSTQKSTGSGPDAFRLAYRVGSSGSFTAIDNSLVANNAALDPIAILPRVSDDSFGALRQTYDFFQLPYTVDDQDIVYLRVYFDGLDNMGRNGNTSINHILVSSGEIDFTWPEPPPVIPPEEHLMFSHPGGIHAAPINNLTITTGIPGGTIRFTTDGTPPTANSPIFPVAGVPIATRQAPAGAPWSLSNPNGRLADVRDVAFNHFSGRPFGSEHNRANDNTFLAPAGPVMTGNVIRAQVFDSSGVPLSRMHTNTYIVTTAPRTLFADMPVIFVTSCPRGLFDFDDGIFSNRPMRPSRHPCPVTGQLIPGYGYNGQNLTSSRNYTQRGRDWERPGHIEFFEPVRNASGQATGQYTLAMDQMIGIRVNGGISRNFAQKSMRLYASSSRDPDNPLFDHDIFDGHALAYDGTPITTFRRFLLRNFGTDWLSGSMRDAMQQRLMQGTHVQTQDSRNAMVFLNGEYWGLYELRERVDVYMVQSKYRLDTTNVAIMQERGYGSGGEDDFPEDFALLNHMYEWFENNPDLSDPELFEIAQSFIDIDNFIDYKIMQIYSNDHDWPHGNFRMWRYQAPGYPAPGTPNSFTDGRWRHILNDLDFGFELYPNEYAPPPWPDGINPRTNENHLFNDLERMLNPNWLAPWTSVDDTRGFPWTECLIMSDAPPPWATVILRRFMTNPDFVEKFVTRSNDLMAANLHPTVIDATITQLANEIRPVMAANMARWNNLTTGIWQDMEHWENHLTAMRNFSVPNDKGLGRQAMFRQHLLATDYNYDLGLSGRSFVAFNVMVAPGHAGRGTFLLNNTNAAVPSSAGVTSWSTEQLTESVQNIMAIPAPGWRFDRFEVGAQQFTTNPLNLTLAGATTVYVFFTESPLYNVIIDSALVNGTITADPDEAEAGDTITLTVTPDIGYRLSTGTLMYNENVITGHTFVMPAADAIVTAKFEVRDVAVIAEFSHDRGVLGQVVDATGGTLQSEANLRFFYANGAPATLGRIYTDLDREPINVPNNAGGWFPAGTIEANNSAGWVITMSTLNYANLIFSADQGSSGSGPRDFALAYRIGTEGSFIPIDSTTPILTDPNEIGNTFDEFELPEAMDNQPVVQLRVYISSSVNRGGGVLDPVNGNTSMNNIVIAGESIGTNEFHTVRFLDHDDTVLDTQQVLGGTAASAPTPPFRPGYAFTGWDQDFSNVTSDMDIMALYAPNTFAPGVIAAFNYDRGEWGKNVEATSGSLRSDAQLQFFYSCGLQATLGRVDLDRHPINVPNHATARWFPEEEINANNSAGWVITLNTTNYENLTFTADQGSSNNGPRDFNLAFRIGTEGSFTTISGTAPHGQILTGANEIGRTFDELLLPAAMANHSVVQLKVYISSDISRGTGNFDAYNSGNTSMNNIVIAGQPMGTTVLVTGVTIDQDDLTLEVGDTRTLTATVVPGNATNSAVTWSSNNTDAVTVNANTGLITAIAPGEAIITVTTVCGNHSDTITIVVLDIPNPTLTSLIVPNLQLNEEQFADVTSADDVIEILDIVRRYAIETIANDKTPSIIGDGLVITWSFEGGAFCTSPGSLNVFNWSVELPYGLEVEDGVETSGTITVRNYDPDLPPTPTLLSLDVDVDVIFTVGISAAEALAMLDAAEPVVVAEIEHDTIPSIIPENWEIEWDVEGTFNPAPGATNTFRWTITPPDGLYVPCNTMLTGTITRTNVRVGDLTGNGRISIMDVALLRTFVVEGGNTLTESVLARIAAGAGNVSGGAAPTMTDVELLRSYVMGMGHTLDSDVQARLAWHTAQ